MYYGTKSFLNGNDHISLLKLVWHGNALVDDLRMIKTSGS